MESDRQSLNPAAHHTKGKKVEEFVNLNSRVLFPLLRHNIFFNSSSSSSEQRRRAGDGGLISRCDLLTLCMPSDSSSFCGFSSLQFPDHLSRITGQPHTNRDSV